MKVKILLILAFVLFPCLVLASPFLVCDAQTNVDSYAIFTVSGTTCTASDLSGKTPVSTPYPIHYDLDGLPSGAFHYCIKAVNVWGQSNAVPFGSTKVLPGEPANTRLSNQ